MQVEGGTLRKKFTKLIIIANNLFFSNRKILKLLIN